MKTKHLPFVKLPREVDVTLFLIREELKSTRFFHGLAGLGLSDCFYQPHLGSLILSELGFEHVPDDLFAFYCNLIERHSRSLEEDMSSLTTHALEVYQALIREKGNHLSV